MSNPTTTSKYGLVDGFALAKRSLDHSNNNKQLNQTTISRRKNHESGDGPTKKTKGYPKKSRALKNQW